MEEDYVMLLLVTESGVADNDVLRPFKMMGVPAIKVCDYSRAIEEAAQCSATIVVLETSVTNRNWEDLIPALVTPERQVWCFLRGLCEEVRGIARHRGARDCIFCSPALSQEGQDTGKELARRVLSAAA